MVRRGVWMYPWDLADRGPREVAEDLAASGVHDVYLALSYHGVHVLSPGNPRRATLRAPRGAVYFRPDSGLWTGEALRPAVSPLLDELDEVGEVGGAGGVDRLARRAFAGTGLRLWSWTVCLHDSALAGEHPEAATVDVWGGRAASLCPANPLARRYAATLVADVAQRVDGVQVEAAHWVEPHAAHTMLAAPRPRLLQALLPLCTCAHCLERVAGEGGDPDRLRRDLRAVAELALTEPSATEPSEAERPDTVEEVLRGRVTDLPALRAARAGAVTSLAAELRSAAGDRPLEFVSYGDRTRSGVDLRDVESAGAAVRVLAYGGADQVRRALADVASSADAPQRFGVGLSALPADAPDEAALAGAYAAAVEAGASSCVHYNYGLLGPERRRWLRRLPAG